MIGRSMLGIALGLEQTQKVDVLEILTTGDSMEGDHKSRKIYALSCLGWGLPGFMAEHTAGVKFLKTQRYWYAGFWGLLTESWPITCKMRLSYPVRLQPLRVSKSSDVFMESQSGKGWVEWLTRAQIPASLVGPTNEKAAIVDDVIDEDEKDWNEEEVSVASFLAASVPSMMMGRY